MIYLELDVDPYPAPYPPHSNFSVPTAINCTNAKYIELIRGTTISKDNFDVYVEYDSGKASILSSNQFTIEPTIVPDTASGTIKITITYNTSEMTLTTEVDVAVNVSIPFGYPTYLINGDFTYPNIGMPWVHIIVKEDGQFYQDSTNLGYIYDWDMKKFGWKSTENKYGGCLVELQTDLSARNQYAELVGTKANTAIYQDIATYPGSKYIWKLNHTSLNSTNIDSMQVVIGAPSSIALPQAAERISQNLCKLDELGVVGTTIATNRSCVPDNGIFNNSGAWETYKGEYIVPEGQYITRFSFQSLSGVSSVRGNLIDDITFSILHTITFIDSITDEVVETMEMLDQTDITLENIPQHDGYIFSKFSKQKATKSGNVYIIYDKLN